MPNQPRKLDGMASADAAWHGLRRQLVDAQVDTLRMYLEKQPTERFVDALERLIECTRASFRQEEEWLQRLAPLADPKHRAHHENLMSRLEDLRQSIMELDRGRLLAQLILIDRELTSHISDVVRAPRPQGRQGVASAAEQADELTHH